MMPTTEQLQDLIPFARTLGIEFTDVTAERVSASLEWSESLTTTGGGMHGGALMALADTAGAVCAVLNLPEGATGTSTIESKTNLLRALREGVVTAVSTPLHAGRTTIVVETAISGPDGRLVAKTTQTQAVLR